MDNASPTSSTGSAIITSMGIGSGLNVSSIVSQLMAVQNQPVALLQAQEANVQATISSFGLLKSALSQFQTSMQGLSDVSKYQNITSTVANSAVASATATSSAVSGTYGLTVSQLAQAQTLVAVGQTSSSNAIGNGVISFNVGTISGGTFNSTTGTYTGATFTNSGSASKTVTIDSSNNSLTGIAAAINAANIGVTATVINDGSNTPYRLSLTSNNTGASNSMQISVTGDVALQNLLNQDPAGTQSLSQTTTAQNAQLTLNGIAVTSPTNTISSVISGVSLNLLTTNPTTPTTLTVSQNTSGALSAVNSFVAAYNSINTAISQATAYDASTKTAGPLQGQNSVLSIASQIRNILNAPVPGASSALSMLAQVGVGFQSDGSLKVDSTALQAALTKNPNAVSGLFASTGTTSDSLISFSGSTSASKPGSYGVNISQLATQGSTTAGAAPTTTTITTGVNDTLNINLNGIASNVVIAAGTYTASSLATAIQSAINGTSAFSSVGSTAKVTQNTGILTITSNQYGSNSSAVVVGGNGAANFNGGGTATTVVGVDVAGTINGVTATGKGQTLTGASGDSSAGLSILVTGGSLGARGTLNFTQGYANELNQLMTTVLGANGQIAAATKGLNSTITSIESSIANQNAINSLIQANYQAEFSALDVTMSKLNGTSTYLTQQLSALAKANTS